MKLPSWMVVALWLLACSTLAAAEKDGAPGYLGRIIGGAKSLLPGTSKAPPVDAPPKSNVLPKNRPPARRGNAERGTTDRGTAERGAANRSPVEPATWNATAEQAADSHPSGSKPQKALRPQPSRTPAQKPGAKAP